MEIDKLSVPCYLNTGAASSVVVYIGRPEVNHNPICFQLDFLSKERGITIPQEIVDTFTKLKVVADKNGVSLIELCKYALESLKSPQKIVPAAITQEEITSLEKDKKDEIEVDKTGKEIKVTNEESKIEIKKRKVVKKTEKNKKKKGEKNSKSE